MQEHGCVIKKSAVQTCLLLKSAVQTCLLLSPIENVSLIKLKIWQQRPVQLRSWRLVQHKNGKDYAFKQNWISLCLQSQTDD